MKRALTPTISIVCSAIIVIAFFLPWIKLGEVEVSGFVLSTMEKKLYFLFGIPIANVANIVFEIKKRRSRMLLLASGFCVFIALYEIHKRVGEQIYQIMTTPFQIVFLAAFALALLSLSKKN